ncbi:hypothetical protein F511_21884 [Dorcoceras hygrometricum]|uniref:Uncharacterized protein n=1 Tax=Dorcoceras hygrometricum TaxID=472368 RepID=A0A2Z7BWV7_9LAMI|nr:hypothetical protein F511_21884 [Dorcoceras hygrometricum]
MSLFDLQDVCIAIGSLATLDTGRSASCIHEPLRVTQVLDSRFPHGYSAQCVEHEKSISGIDRSDLIGDRSYDEVAAMDIVIWTRARWAGPSPFTNAAASLSQTRRRRRRPRAAAAATDRRRKSVSGQFVEEYSFVLISSALLVQPDEGVSDLVVDRIGDNLPQSTEKCWILVIPVGARHKCQQAIGSLATLDLPMVVDLIGIYGLKGPYCTLTSTDWFLQALSVIPSGSWGDVARRFTMIRWAIDRSDLIGDRSYDEVAAMDIVIWTRARWSAPTPPPSLKHAAAAAADRRRKSVSGQFVEEYSFVLISSALLVQPDEGVSDLVMDRIGDNLPQSTEKSRILVIPVGARHKCQQVTVHSEYVPSRLGRQNEDKTAELETSICDAKYHVSLSTRSVLGKWVCLVTLVMSLFDRQDVCIDIGSIAILDLPMVVDLIGIYVLKGPYYTLTTTNWFLQALSVIHRGSWGDVARRFTMIQWVSPKL